MQPSLQFAADEASDYVASSNALVTITDDTMHEMEEYFILSLKVVDAPFPHRIHIQGYSASIVRIVDNDGTCAVDLNIVMYVVV